MKDNKENKEELKAEATALMKKLEPFMERTKELLKTKNHSTEELEELYRLWKVFNKVWPVLETLGNFFGENAYKQQVSAYYHIKELAARGDIKAQKAIEELKPLFEEALKERMNGSES